MKKLMVIVLAGCALVVSQGFRNVAADDEGSHGIPLRKLAGTYAATVQGSLAVCLANTAPFAPVPCDSPNPLVVRNTFTSVGVYTFDAVGNWCATNTQTSADLPVGASPTSVSVSHNVGHITRYDPTTGEGDKSGTDYTGGQCHGATFDSTGATVNDTETSHFVVSNHGKRIDGVVTSLSIDPAGAIGGFSVPFTFLRH